jgi:hypothetical protein
MEADGRRAKPISTTGIETRIGVFHCILVLVYTRSSRLKFSCTPACCKHVRCQRFSGVYRVVSLV